MPSYLQKLWENWYWTWQKKIIYTFEKSTEIKRSQKILQNNIKLFTKKYKILNLINHTANSETLEHNSRGLVLRLHCERCMKIYTKLHIKSSILIITLDPAQNNF